ncbi:MAG: T9SS type A sorting domain-containing protein, partial [Bacteroidota bacterium]
SFDTEDHQVKQYFNFASIDFQRPITDAYALKTYPNIFQDEALFEFQTDINEAVFELYDFSGKLLLQQKIQGRQFTLERSQLSYAGTYFYKISEKLTAVNAGRLVVN